MIGLPDRTLLGTSVGLWDRTLTRERKDYKSEELSPLLPLPHPFTTIPFPPHRPSSVSPNQSLFATFPQPLDTCLEYTGQVYVSPLVLRDRSLPVMRPVPMCPLTLCQVGSSSSGLSTKGSMNLEYSWNVRLLITFLSFPGNRDYSSNPFLDA